MKWEMKDETKNLCDVVLQVVFGAGAVVAFFVGLCQFEKGVTQFEISQKRNYELELFKKKIEAFSACVSLLDITSESHNELNKADPDQARKFLDSIQRPVNELKRLNKGEMLFYLDPNIRYKINEYNREYQDCINEKTVPLFYDFACKKDEIVKLMQQEIEKDKTNLE